MSDEGDCKTAPATPALLMMVDAMFTIIQNLGWSHQLRSFCGIK